MQIRLHFLLASFGLFASIGCSSSLGPVPIPEVNAKAGQAAIQEFDSDGDQSIDEEELARSPGLRNALSRIDKNKNKRITADEINQRIKVWHDAGIGVAQCTVTVR
jgi:hypothetical protein